MIMIDDCYLFSIKQIKDQGIFCCKDYLRYSCFVVIRMVEVFQKPLKMYWMQILIQVIYDCDSPAL